MHERTSEANKAIAEHIRQYGWHCLHVFPRKGDDSHVEFSYSIGFAQSYKAPEVMVFGLQREKGHALLNECAQLLAAGETIELDVPDERILTRDFKVVFRPVPGRAHSEYLGTAIRYYGNREFAAVLMHLPDQEGVFPWDLGYSGLDGTEALSITGSPGTGRR